MKYKNIIIGMIKNTLHESVYVNIIVTPLMSDNVYTLMINEVSNVVSDLVYDDVRASIVIFYFRHSKIQSVHKINVLKELSK